MAKRRVTLWFHGEDAFGPLLESARTTGADETVKGAAPFPMSTGRILPAVARLVNAVGSPALVSLTNERLLRAFSDPQEKKALADGASRRRLLPVTTAALGAELRLFAPFETADELRLNADLWKQALITPPFAIVPLRAHRTAIYSADPAAELADYRPKGDSDVLCIDLGSIERGPDPEGAMQRLAERLKELPVASPSPERPGAIDSFLRDVLIAGARAPRFAPDRHDGYDVGDEGFPIDLLHALLPEAVATRTLAPHGVDVLQSAFDLSALAAPVARGLMLRSIARGAGPDDVCPLARARASFLLAAALLAHVAADAEATAATTPAAASEKVPLVARHLRASLRRAGDDAAAKADALPEPPAGDDPAAFLAAVRAMATAGLGALDEALATQKDPCVA